MAPDPLSVVLLRFGLGVGAGMFGGLLTFRLALFEPSSVAFHCITIGGLVAGVLALLRSGRSTQALAVTVGFALLRLGFAQSQGWPAAIGGTFLVVGVFVVALIFDLLARSGIRFGKFLILGPLLGGLYLAVTPLSEFRQLAGPDLEALLMRHLFLGVLIGDTVGLGTEVADLLLPKLRGESARPGGPGRPSAGGVRSRS